MRDSDDAERVKRGRIFPWKRTRRSLGRSSYQSWEGRLQYPQLVDCTTATNDAVSKRIGANTTRHWTRWFQPSVLPASLP